MYQNSVSSQKFSLQIYDTSHLKAAARFKTLKPYLQAYLKASEDFIWGKGRDSLKFPTSKYNWQLSLTLCGDQRMRTLNRNFRQKDKTTDVLSFQYFDSRQELRDSSKLPELHLGDLFISLNMAAKQARSFDLSLNEELLHLVVHGFLHLLDFDHDRGERERIEMEQKELWLINRARFFLKR